MINVSNEFKELMQKNTKFKCNAEVELASGTTLTLGNSAFSSVNNSITDAAGANALPLGAAVSRVIQIELINDKEQYKDVDFFGAKIRLYLTFDLSATTEKIEMGTFTVINPESYGETVIVTAQDDMYKTDKKYTSGLTFPATLSAIFRDACTTCGIPFQTSAFTNSDFIVTSKPSSDLTFRQVFGYIAMIAAGNARINRFGYMEILTYDFSTTQHQLKSWKTVKVETNDITITGIQTTISVEGDDGINTEETILEGDEGYVLSVSNPLIAGKEVDALSRIGAVLVGATFRKFEGDHIAYPIAEFMDTATITDRKGNVYNTVLTDVNFVFYGYTTLSNSAEAELRNRATYQAPDANAVIKARELVEKERTARETAMEQLSNRISTSSGLYQTTEKQLDGSTIYYLHDKPTLEESQNVIKLTAEVIGFSTDGGKTYPYGFTIDGETVTRLLAAEGINADWINAGAFTVVDADGNIIFSADTDTGRVNISGDVLMGDSTLGASILEASQPNLAPYFSRSFADTGYWGSISTSLTQLSNGWVHVSIDNTAGTSEVYRYFRPRYGTAELKTSTEYTFMVEIRNATTSGTVYVQTTYPEGTGGQFATNSFVTVTENGTYYRKATTRDSFENSTTVNRGIIQVNAGAKVEMDVRVSLYEGDYSGPYKEYINPLNQKTILELLTNGGGDKLSDGIYQVNGQLLINATHIIAGILSDKNGLNRWDLDTGEFSLSGYATDTAAKNYADEAAKREALLASQPNLAPYFSQSLTNTDYWYSIGSEPGFTKQLDGWVHVNIDNTTGTSAKYYYFRPRVGTAELKPSTTYTFMIETKNVAVSGNVFVQPNYSGSTIAGQFATSNYSTVTSDRTVYLANTTKSSFADSVVVNTGLVEIIAGAKVEMDLRISLYEGTYKGVYKQYVPVLTQQEVFNLLTNNGAIQGIYMKNGKLYINGEYIAAGILTDAKGSNYWNLDTGEFSLSGYATDGELADAANTAQEATEAAQEAAEAYADEVARRESQPNLAPYFSRSLADTGYWNTISTSLTQLKNGWVHVSIDNTAGTSAVYRYFRPRYGTAELKTSTLYTFMVEMKNVTASGTAYVQPAYAEGSTVGQFATSRSTTVTTDKTAYLTSTTRSNFENSTVVNVGLIQANAGAKVEMDLRISLYEGTYNGVYKQYVPALTQEEAFNLLTNSGAIKGIYMRDGQLYINASYLQSGALSVKNSAGTEIFKADVDKGTLSIVGYATDSELTEAANAAQEAAQEAAEAYADEVARRESQPNLAPYFSRSLADTGYWNTISTSLTQLKNGWVHVSIDNTAGTSAVYRYFRPRYGTAELKTSTEYTFMVEIRNATTSGTVYVQTTYAGGTGGQFATDSFVTVKENGTYYRKATTRDSFENSTTVNRGVIQVNAGAKADFEVRVSLYEGTYNGVYKQYVPALTQEETFNLLTNSGALQGLYLADGKIYINAEYIKSGAIVITDANGNVTFSADTETGKIIIDGSGGKVSFNNTPMTISGTKIFYSSNYTEDDVTRIRDIILDAITPTAADFEKYDFYGDGEITTTDLLHCNNMVNQGKNLTVTWKCTIDPTSKNSILKIWREADLPTGDSSTDVLLEAGAGGVTTMRLPLAGTTEDTFVCANSAGYVYKSNINPYASDPVKVVVAAGEEISVNLTDGDVISISYVMSELSSGDVLFKVNGDAPTAGGYTYTGAGGTSYSGGIITYGGTTTYGTFSGTLKVVGNRVLLEGSGIRGNSASSFGWCVGSWAKSEVSTISFSRAGTLSYKRI